MFVIGIRGRRKFKFLGLAAQFCDKCDFFKLDHLEVKTQKIL